MRQSSNETDALRGNRHHWLAGAIFGGILAVWGAGMAFAVSASSADDAQAGTVVSMFAPGEAEAALAAIRSAGGRLLDNPTAGAWVVHGPDPGFAGRLRDAGALGVFEKMPVSLPGASGCFFIPDGQQALSSRRVAPAT